MLVLSRREGESVVLTKDSVTITVTIMEVRNSGQVRIGFEAPPEVKIIRDNAIRQYPMSEAKQIHEAKDGRR